jgi:hypothetical protein
MHGIYVASILTTAIAVGIFGTLTRKLKSPGESTAALAGSIDCPAA